MLSNMQAFVLPGSGVVARTKHAILVVRLDNDEGAIADLIDIVREVSTDEADGRLLARQLVRHIVEADEDGVPGFGVVTDDNGKLVFVVHNDVVIQTVGTDGEIEHSARGSLSGADGFLEVADVVRILTPDATSESGGFRGDLIEGVVPGSGVTILMSNLVRPQAPDSEAGPSVEESHAEDKEDSTNENRVAPVIEAVVHDPIEPESEDDDEDAFEVFDLSDLQQESIAALPIEGTPPAQSQKALRTPPGVELIRGVRCKNGHFNHPEARYCAQCGIGMVQETKNLIYDARPPLGIIVFNDGSTYLMDADYVVGRDPANDPAVLTGKARPIRLEDDDRVSRAHLSLWRDGWDVYVIDHSANGTEKFQDGDWRSLMSEQRERLEPGTEVKLSTYQFTYESNLRHG